MILQKNEIKDIISKIPNAYGNLEIEEVEFLNLIETYIFYKTGKKVGDIEAPTSILSKGLKGRVLSQRHLQLMHIAVDFAWNYFAKELNNSFTEEKQKILYLCINKLIWQKRKKQKTFLQTKKK